MQVEKERIVRLRTVIERTGLSRATIYRKVRKGTFPRQIILSDRCVGWRESALERWLASLQRDIAAE